jgi:hypothetical protein
VAVHRFVKPRHTAAVRVEDAAELFEHGQIARDAAADLVHIACTERDEQIAGAQRIADLVACDQHRRRAAEVLRLWLQRASGLLRRISKNLAAHAGQRLFARGIDVGDEQLVHIAKTRAELLLQKLRAAVAMRLEEADDALRAQTLRRGQRGGDFTRMMAVVIHHGEMLAAVPDLEAAFRTAEATSRHAGWPQT